MAGFGEALSGVLEGSRLHPADTIRAANARAAHHPSDLDHGVVLFHSQWVANFAVLGRRESIQISISMAVGPTMNRA